MGTLLGCGPLGEAVGVSFQNFLLDVIETAQGVKQGAELLLCFAVSGDLLGRHLEERFPVEGPLSVDQPKKPVAGGVVLRLAQPLDVVGLIELLGKDLVLPRQNSSVHDSPFRVERACENLIQHKVLLFVN